MAYTVFFKESNQIITAGNFIQDQPMGHRALLTDITNELAAKGTITYPQVKKNSKGEWSILINDEDGMYTYTAFVSKFENLNDDSSHRAESKEPNKGVLVIIDPSGPRDSIGGYHPGYWFAEEYVNFLSENQKTLFTEVIDKIRRQIPSGNYALNGDGSVSIYVQKQTNTSIVSLSFRAEWV